MRNINSLYIYTLIFIGSLLFSSCKERKLKDTDWIPNYQHNSTLPYGTYITHQLLDSVFDEVNVSYSQRRIQTDITRLLHKELQPEIYDSKSKQFSPLISNVYDEQLVDFYQNLLRFNTSTLAIVTSKFPSDPAIETALCHFVGLGNTVFISAETISHSLLESLSVSDSIYPIMEDSPYLLLDNPQQTYTFPAYYEKRIHDFRKNMSSVFVTDSIKLPFNVLGTTLEGSPSFIQIKYGLGYFYLHTVPRAFTNITMLNIRTYVYGFKCLSVLPKNQDIVWNESIKDGKHEKTDRSLLSVILKHPSLKWGFILLLVGLFLFMLFRGKRMQRVIPIIKKKPNTTLEFLDTLSNMYYRKKDYHSSMKKRQAYFLEFIRTNYYMQTENTDKKFIQILSRKSKVPESTIERIFELYNVPKEAIDIDYYINYNKELENFYRKAQK